MTNYTRGPECQAAPLRDAFQKHLVTLDTAGQYENFLARPPAPEPDNASRSAYVAPDGMHYTNLLLSNGWGPGFTRRPDEHGLYVVQVKWAEQSAPFVVLVEYGLFSPSPARRPEAVLHGYSHVHSSAYQINLANIQRWWGPVFLPAVVPESA